MINLINKPTLHAQSDTHQTMLSKNSVEASGEGRIGAVSVQIRMETRYMNAILTPDEAKAFAAEILNACEHVERHATMKAEAMAR
jgi:hypothetical protein